MQIMGYKNVAHLLNKTASFSILFCNNRYKFDLNATKYLKLFQIFEL
ncbi:hypothetical protein L289_0112 [Acinetobacter gerneri DSM 14967 = CIP 107464 = MTCC 9824]|nr:hypothetical protein L289_0112 [Acinetobacter gerneri DSM 14967 = CIP 107464 = MTCC 9824]